MPFYEYQCTACGHRVEALQKISDDPLVYCPECNAAALKKLISAAGFRLKGTGWYETDFKNSGRKKADGQSGGEKTDGGKSGETTAATGKTESGKSEGTKSDSGKTSGGGSGKSTGSGGSGESQAA